MPAPRRLERIRPRVKAVTISGDAGDESQLQDLLEIEPGDPYDFFTIRRGLQRIEERLIEQGHLQSRVRLERQVQADRQQSMFKSGPVRWWSCSSTALHRQPKFKSPFVVNGIAASSTSSEVTRESMRFGAG